jgi:hypothetical protein
LVVISQVVNWLLFMMLSVVFVGIFLERLRVVRCGTDAGSAETAQKTPEAPLRAPW